MRDEHDDEARESLRKSERKRATLYETIPGMVYRGGADWSAKIVCNSKELCGYSAGEFERGEVNWRDLVHPDDQQRTFTDGSDLAERAAKLVQEYRIITKGGTVRWVEDHKTSHFENDGVFAGVDGFVFDITKRKEMEASLLESEERRRAFMDSAPCAFAAFDSELNLITINKIALGMHPPGTKIEDVIGKNLMDLSPDIEEKGEIDKYLEVMRTGKPIFLEDVSSGGKYGNVHLSVSAFKVGDGLGIIATDITERKKAHEALRESERKYRTLVANIPDVIWRTDFEGNTVFISPNVEEIYGYSPDEICSQGESLWFGRIHPDDAERVRKAFGALFEDNIHFDLEYRIKKKTGEWMWLHDRSMATSEIDGVRCADGVFADVTERKEAEQEARRSQTLIQGILDNTDAFIVVRDTHGRYLLVNKQVEDVLGMKSDEIIGKTPFDIHSKDKAEKILADDKRVIESGKLLEIEDELDVRGQTRTFLGSIFPLLDTTGAPYAVCTAVGDITDRRAAEDALKESEEKFRRITEHSFDAVVAADLNGILTYASPSVIRVLGYRPDEMIGRGPVDFMPESSVERVKQVLIAMAGGEESPVAIEIDAWKKDGVIAKMELNSVSVCKDGEVIGVQASLRDITERKLAEEEVKKFKTIAEKAGYGNAISDLDGNLIHLNESFAKMHGYRIDELEGKNLSIFHTEEQMERVNRLNERLGREGSFVGEEVWHRRKDDTTFPTLMNATLIRDESGSPLFMAATAIDATVAKQAEASLRQSEQRYRTLVENLPQRVFLKDRDLIYVSCNENFACDLGINPEDVAGKSDYDFFATGLAEKYRADDKRVMESGEIKDIEDVYILGGREMTVHTVKTPVRDEDGKVVGALGIFWDITEQKRLERALGESEEKYRTLVESAGETIVTIARDGKYLFMNKIGAERAGRKAEDYIGKTMWDMFPKHIADRQMKLIRQVIDSGEGVNLTVQAELQGQLRWYNATVKPLRGSSGAVSAALVVARDIHEIRQAEMELDAYREKMTRAEQLASLGTLSATLAHELTQPLTVIGLSIEDALAELEGISCPEAVGEGLRDSLSEVSNVTAIVERFRSFARKSSGKTVEKVGLRIVGERIIKLLKKSAQQSRVSVHLRGIDKLPDVYMNEKDLEQLFFALVQNAIHAADGKKAHNLVIEGGVKSEYIELRFSDDCGGIEQADVDRVFEPFFTTKSAGEGTGLGLCMVQRVAERSGGRVRVENRPGDGVTFVVTLGISKDSMPYLKRNEK